MPTLFINSVQRFLNRFGLRVTRVPACVEPIMPFDLLELAIVQALHVDPASFYFVQIGAKDGVKNDFLSALVRRYGLAGCLVEPVPALFETLKTTYRDQPQLDFRNSRVEGHETAEEAESAPAESFAGFVETLPARGITLLYVDTDGNDDRVIAAAFRANVFPAILHYEWTEMSLERRCALKRLLLDHDYRFMDVGADTVCLRLRDAHVG